MCSRFLMDQDDLSADIKRILEEMNRKKQPDGLKTEGEIFPTDIVPVLANSRQGDIRPFAMRWGYSFPGSNPVINACSETAALKPLFRDGMLHRRCLIPASCYFEWERRQNGQRIKYAIRPEKAETFYLAGIYHLEKHGLYTVPTFAVLTRQAAKNLTFIHDRMPVLFSNSVDWLNPEHDAGDLLALAIDQMRFQAA